MSLNLTVINPIVTAPAPTPEPDLSSDTSEPEGTTPTDDTQNPERTGETVSESSFQTGSGTSDTGSAPSSQTQTAENGSTSLVAANPESLVQARAQAQSEPKDTGEALARQLAEVTQQKLRIEQLIESVAVIRAEAAEGAPFDGTEPDTEGGVAQDRLIQRI